jgi:serine/tyrosine/threonine adenylyltransferase
LKIPTTRALALTVLPNKFALRERVETCAIVCRMAESWIRIGTFDLFRNRGDRETTRKLAEYCISHVFSEEELPYRREGEEEPNRFERLYREICLRNARTVAMWLSVYSIYANCRQAYGFMNGVLNTDNTSIFGLSLDFGPFAVLHSTVKLTLSLWMYDAISVCLTNYRHSILCIHQIT